MKHLYIYRRSLLLLAFVNLALLSCCHGEPSLPVGAKAFRDLAYVENGHANQKLDLYLPAVIKGPLLVCIHGGAWRAGSKNNGQAVQLLGLGYAVASIEYRFTQHAIFPAQIEDCKAAIRWLRKHASDYGYDPAHVAVMGDSAGGHLVALLATTGNVRDFDVGANLDQSSAVQCGIDFYGPSDFPGWKPATGDPMVQRTGSESALTQLLGGELADKMELAKRASPVTWVTKDAAPLFILHGTKDPLVGLDQSTELADKLKAAGADVTLEVIEGAGHGGKEFFDEGRPERMIAFLKKHLETP